MECSTGVVATQLSEVEPGSLVHISYRGNSVTGIVMDSANGRVRMGSLLPLPPPLRLPTQLDFRTSDYCLNYGRNWLLEPLAGNESYLDNIRLLGTPGCLYLSGNSYVVCFHRDGGFDEIYFNISEPNIVEPPSRNSVPYLRWRIWESRSHYENSRATEFLTVEPTANPS